MTASSPDHPGGGRRLLIVDDERAARVGLRRALGRRGYEIAEAEDGEVALETIAAWRPDVVVLDLNMPKLDGPAVLDRLREQAEAEEIAGPDVIVLTAYGSEKVAVDAMKRGALDYLTKPYDVEELRLTVAKAFERRDLTTENRRLREALDEQDEQGYAGLVGRSEAMRAVYDVIERVAGLDVSILLTGESGTGKELAARAIHGRSRRSGGPFVPINCAALPEPLVESELFGHRRGAFTGAERDRKGKFELACGGTLLLDEIGDMSLEVQAKLLRALEEQVIEPVGSSTPVEVDVRVIAATHKDLEEAMREGRFRRDLYYRLKVVELHLPRLADRREDIPLLVRHFVERLARKHGRPQLRLAESARAALESRAWPGNVRELRNVLESCYALATGDELEASDLPPSSDSEVPEHAALTFPEALLAMDYATARRTVIRDFECAAIERALKAESGNVSAAARALGLHRQSLQAKLKELGISANRFRDG